MDKMSWLSDGLNQFSNLTGQISSFTKEVLTETTEEVTDPGAELQVLRQKHADLEKSHQSLQAELHRLKAVSEERKEQVETAEFQISTISQEYRKLLENKDVEIRRLRTENERLKEDVKGFTGDSGSDMHSPLKELAELQLRDLKHSGGVEYESVDIAGGGEWVDHFHEDFSDVITSQAEINRLRSQLAKLRREMQHWKTLAENKTEENTDSGAVSTEQVKMEKERHEQEVSTLQAVHQQKLQSLSKRHQQEIGQLQDQLDLLSQQGAGATVASQKIAELEELNSTLLQQLDQLKFTYRQEQKTNSELAQKLQEEQVSTSQLKSELQSLREQNLQEKSLQEQSLLKEKENLLHQLEEMHVRILDHQNSMSTLQQEHEKTKRESQSLQEQLTTLAGQLSDKEMEIGHLKQELELHEERLHQQSDATSQVPLVEATATHQVKEGEREVTVFKEELQRTLGQDVLKTKSSQMEYSLLGQSEGSTDWQAVATQVRGQLRDCQQALERSQQELGEGATAQAQLKELLSAREQENKSLTRALEESKLMTSSDQSVLSKLRVEEEAAAQKCAALETANAGLREEIASLKNRAQVEGQVIKSDQLQVLQQENAKSSRQLAGLRSHLMEIEEQHTQESIRAGQREADLRHQLAELQRCLVEARAAETKLNNQNQKQLLDLEQQLQTMKEERDDTLLNMTNAQDQAHINAESLRTLQTVLEQFQQDQSSELGQALKKSQLELAAALNQCQCLQQECTALREQVSSQSASQHSCQQQLQLKEHTIAQLTEEGARLRLLLQDSQAALDKFPPEPQVDRSLVKNLVLGYVHATEAKKPEVLQLIAKILDFSAEEFEQAMCGQSRSRGWLTGWWRNPDSLKPPQAQTSSLAQLFIKFLESESSAHTPIAVPVSGYIDPHTDPDKPSLATATLLGPPQSHDQDKPSLTTATLLGPPQSHDQDKPSLSPSVHTHNSVQSHDQKPSLGTRNQPNTNLEHGNRTEHNLGKPAADTTPILNQSSLLKSVLAD